MKIQDPTFRSLSTTALALVCTAGLAVPALGQANRGDRDRDMDQKQKQRAAASQRDGQPSGDRSQSAMVYHFHRVSALMGSEIESVDGTSIATVDDLVIDRGSGGVSHVVTLANDILGLGGDRIAVPYEAIRFDEDGDRLTLDLTDSEIERFGDRVPNGWTRIESGDLSSELGKLSTHSDRGQHAQKPSWFAEMMKKGGETQRVTGTLQSVERTSDREGTEYVVLGIRDGESGKTMRVVTGPSWFVMDGETSLERDTQISAEVVKVDARGDYSYAARGLETKNGSMPLWKDDGKPAWAGSSRNGGHGSMITASHLMGIGVSARGDNAGEIQDALLESRSGKLAVLLLDPDDNLFGIGDELKCVPWTVASVGNERLQIDAAADTLEKCENVPEDLTMISTPVEMGPIYEVFNVSVVELEPRERSRSNRKRSGD